MARGEDEGAFRTTYTETFENIARVRFLGYDSKEAAIDLLKAAGPVELALVATFNDTSDGGNVKLFQPQRRVGWSSVGGASCPEASRWGFRIEVDGLVETGHRAGNDFTLAEQYGDETREMIPLDEMERISDEVLEQLKTEARVVAEEGASNRGT